MQKGSWKLLTGAGDGDSQDGQVWRLVTSGSRTKAPLPAELQLQSRYSALGTGSSGKPGEVVFALGKGRAQVHGDVHWNGDESAESTRLKGRGQNNVGDIMAGIYYRPPDRKPALDVWGKPPGWRPLYSCGTSSNLVSSGKSTGLGASKPGDFWKHQERFLDTAD